MDTICIENAVETDWQFDAQSGEAHLYFLQAGRRSRPIRFALDSVDRDRLSSPKSAPELWRAVSRSDDKNGILKLQYRSGRRGHVSLYWVNYAIEHYMESRLREFCHDWDLEVTLRRWDV